MNWKDTTMVLNRHLKSDCHREAIKIHKLPKKTGDVGEKLSFGHKKRELNRKMFRRILQNICDPISKNPEQSCKPIFLV